MIIEYMLIREAGNKLAPSWIEDGGYFADADNKTLIGWSPDFKDRDYYVPDTVLTLNRAALITRQLDINARFPAQKTLDNGDTVLITNEEIVSMVNDWCDAHGEP